MRVSINVWQRGRGWRHTHEQIVGVRVRPANLEELHQVMELPVDVAADGDGAFLQAVSNGGPVASVGER